MRTPTRLATVASGLLAAAGLATGCSVTGTGADASASPRVSATPTVSPTQGVIPSKRARHHRRAHQPVPRRTASPSTAAPAAVFPSRPSKILVVVEENHSLAQMRGGMPYLDALSDRYAYATHWSALSHPSEPNYLAIAGGSTFGIVDDRSPAANASKVGQAPSVFGQAIASGHTAATYAETMPQPCHVYDAPDPSQGRPLYAVRHNPWVYFQSERQLCLQHDLGMDAFHADAAAHHLPDVGFVVPNLDDDAHDGTLAHADDWLRAALTPVLASPDFRRGRLMVVVTADEDDKHSGNVVLTSLLWRPLAHVVVTTPLTHYSLTRAIDDVIAQPRLGNAAGAPDVFAALAAAR